jgi:nucleoid DNA-binding protein
MNLTVTIYQDLCHMEEIMASLAIKQEAQQILSKSVRKVKPIRAKMSRNEIIQTIAEETGLRRTDIDLVFDTLADLVKSHMKSRGSGEFMIPKLGLKIKRIRRKATKQRTMVSPLTNQEVVIPPKPARWDVKLIALKVLKEAVQ